MINPIHKFDLSTCDAVNIQKLRISNIERIRAEHQSALNIINEERSAIDKKLFDLAKNQVIQLTDEEIEGLSKDKQTAKNLLEKDKTKIESLTKKLTELDRQAKETSKLIEVHDVAISQLKGDLELILAKELTESWKKSTSQIRTVQEKVLQLLRQAHELLDGSRLNTLGNFTHICMQYRDNPDSKYKDLWEGFTDRLKFERYPTILDELRIIVNQQEKNADRNIPDLDYLIEDYIKDLNR